MNPEVTARINRYTEWKAELEKLRQVILECGLTEEYKWEEPCYTLEGANIALLHAFKDYCAILFFKGVLMKDPEGILIQQTENVQAGRQIRFTSIQEIERMTPVIKRYVQEAIAVERSGQKVVHKKTEEYDVPDELLDAFNINPGFKNAFEALTPGRQRGYLLYFAGAKQSKTREERIQKWMDAIFDGIGLQDEYKQSKGS